MQIIMFYSLFFIVINDKLIIDGPDLLMKYIWAMSMNINILMIRLQPITTNKSTVIYVHTYIDKLMRSVAP